MFLQAVKERLVVGPRCRGLVNDYDVETFEVRTMRPEGFPDNPLQAVAANCAAAMFF